MIFQIIITSLVIWGVYFTTRVKYSLIEDKFTQKEIFWFVKWYGDKHLPEFIRKPIYDCPMCMSSFWSLVLSVYFGFDCTLIFTPFAVCGLNYYLDRTMYSE